MRMPTTPGEAIRLWVQDRSIQPSSARHSAWSASSNSRIGIGPGLATGPGAVAADFSIGVQHQASGGGSNRASTASTAGVDSTEHCRQGGVQALRQSWEERMADLFRGRSLPFSSEAAHWTGELVSRRARLARPISSADAVIAATTLAHRLHGCVRPGLVGRTSTRSGLTAPCH